MIGVVQVLIIICVLTSSCCILVVTAKETLTADSYKDPVKDIDNTISGSKYDYVGSGQ